MSDITPKQADDVAILQRRLGMSDELLDLHCRSRFNRRYPQLSRRERNVLIEEMAGWKHLPPALQIARGETALPGMGV
ncbi:MAG: hypothetical protein E6Q97_19450 [Desulfurellales bacterium]|nr:MAG: hypothetical protein E6Q97_19450 [Desulfurellales bacterium]